MQNLRFIGRTVDGGSVALESPLKLELTKSYDTPADSLEAVFAHPLGCPALVTLQLMYGDTVLFDGYVDEQREQEGAEATLTLQARSAGSLLVDNEALPQFYYAPRLSDLFQNHIRPYGFSYLDTAQNYRMAFYTVTKGLSEWEAFVLFCRRAAGLTPFVREGRVVVQPFQLYRRYVLSNQGDDPAALPYCNLERIWRRCAVISRIIIRNDQGVYSSMVTNPLMQRLNIRRKRYFIPSSEYDYRPTQDADQQLRRSNLAYLSYKVTLPGVHALLPMDTVDIHHPTLGRSGLFVAQVTHRLTAAGLVTQLILADPTYL